MTKPLTGQTSTLKRINVALVKNALRVRGTATRRELSEVTNLSQPTVNAIINMLRESLQIESISNLIHIIGGEPDDKTDDLISDDELYHRYVDMVACNQKDEGGDIVARAAAAAEGFLGIEGDKLSRILQVMFYAHSSALIKERAREILSTLD